ncbi:hypothetical protein [Actinacidiphila yeochonensis]|uniref:hypothetical protein n=1 Tax=Actinacidiphila yeochonensis TaxID=89050 RepID=UPI0006900D41|nr:hypothetical protein [Actinacidiphila yeochonensis]
MTGVRARLLDAYCHGYDPGDLGLGGFEALLPGEAAPGTTLFDSPAGYAVRRWCPPLLGLEPHCPPARYLARRRELGAFQAVRLLLRGAGIAGYVVDSGEPGGLASAKELAEAAGAPAGEAVRLEPLIQQVADTSGTVDAFLANLAEAVHSAAPAATALCLDGALPCGGVPGTPAFPAGSVEPALPGAAALGEPGCGSGCGCGGAGDTGPPGPLDVRRAAGRWLAVRRVRERPADPVLLRHLRWQAVAAGLPLLLRYPCGGPGPGADAAFLRAAAGLGADVVLLPPARHEAAAALLAAQLPHVHVAVGGDPSAVLASTPFGKVLYGSGAAGLPELHVAAAGGFRVGLGRLVAERVAAGEWSRADGERVTSLVCAGNAARLFPQAATAPGAARRPLTG